MDKNGIIYMDYNATTPVHPEVVDAMIPYLRDFWGNPSSSHAYGRRAAEAVELARAQVAESIGALPGEIYFTSGGTESNNLAIMGVCAARPDLQSVVTSDVEHPATEEPCRLLERRSYQITRLEVDHFGRAIVPPDLDLSDVALVTIMHSNNETGTLQPVRELVELATRHEVPVHTDAAQSLGKVPINVNQLGVDLLSIAGHKLYAPKGIGALYVRTGTPIEPFTRGAGHERGLRPGTENVASIVGLGRAAELAVHELKAKAARLTDLRDRLHGKLKSQIPGLELNGHPDERLPNTLSVRFPRVKGAELLTRSDIAASTGAACHKGEDKASAVILKMGVSMDEALGTVRLTLGQGTTEEIVDQAAFRIVEAWTAMKR